MPFDEINIIWAGIDAIEPINQRIYGYFCTAYRY